MTDTIVIIDLVKPPWLDPLAWPPRDPYDSLKQSWEQEAAKQPRKSRYPPYHPKYSALEAEDDNEEDDEDDDNARNSHSESENDEDDVENDDDIPLANLHTRAVRLRRGSEGFEIRPRGLTAIRRRRADGMAGESSDENVHLETARDDHQGSSGEDEIANEQDVGGSSSDWEELFEKRPPALYDSASDDE